MKYFTGLQNRKDDRKIIRWSKDRPIGAAMHLGQRARCHVGVADMMKSEPPDDWIEVPAHCLRADPTGGHMPCFTMKVPHQVEYTTLSVSCNCVGGGKND